MTRLSNKRPVETFIVAKASQAWYNTGGSSNHINNLSTGAVRLADGQIGTFRADAYGNAALNTATDITPTATEAPSLYLAQGTPWSASPSTPSQSYPLWNEPFVSSGPINAASGVLITKQLPAVGTHSVWIVGSEVSANAITALDNTEYTIRIGMTSLRDNIQYAPEAVNYITASYTTPNYTTLATQDPVDHLIQNMVWNIDRQSAAIAINRGRFNAHSNVVALAINVTGNSNGTPIGGNGDGASGTTALATGQVVPVINTNVGVRSITLTEAMADSIKNAAVAAAIEFGTATTIANLQWNILTVDTTTAGLTANGVADLIMLVSLDSTPAFKDTIPQVRTRLRVGLTSGFDFSLVNNDEYEDAVEPIGQYRALDLWYKATHGQRRYTLNHVEDPIIAFTSPILSTAEYVVYCINHGFYTQVDTSNLVDSPLMTIVCIPDTESTLIAAFDTAFNSWLASHGQPNIDTL